MNRQTMVMPKPVGWLTAVGIHAGRILRRWSRTPEVPATAIGMPTLMILMTKVIFSGMVEQFTGAELKPGNVALMVGVSMAFTGALTGAGTIVQERHLGIADRMATLPGPSSTGFVGRLLAEAVRALVSLITALVLGLIQGANFGPPAAWLMIAPIILLVGFAAGAVGVLAGYMVETPQGAVSFAPLIMAAMFFNTAMMPREMYAEALRPIVDVSPITAVNQIIGDVTNQVSNAGNLVIFLAWYGGLIVLSLLILAYKAATRRN